MIVTSILFAGFNETFPDSERQRNTELEKDYPHICDWLRREVFNDLSDQIEFAFSLKDLIIVSPDRDRQYVSWTEIKGWKIDSNISFNVEELYDIEKELSKEII